MEVIRDVVTTIVIILILASLLEMILPNSTMQPFVKVIMGLFIIVTLLNPIIGLINKDLTGELTNWQLTNQDQELVSILEKGKDISEGSKDKAILEYEKRLGSQILSLANLTNNSLVQEAQVKVVKDEKQDNFGQIQEVLLIVSGEGLEGDLQDKGIIEPVTPIKVQIKGEEQESQARDPTKEVLASYEGIEDVIDAIKNFYSLNEEQIKILDINN